MTHSRKPNLAAGIITVFLCVLGAHAQVTVPVDPVLGPAPKSPVDISGLPGKSPRKLDTTPALNIDSSSREQVRQFYNAIYPASDGIPIDSSAVIANCDPGTNSTAFQNAVLLRINWFRAMSGIPADITFSASDDDADQSAALMMSANDQLQHDVSTNWSCYTSSGAAAAMVSDIALGTDGPDAITGYMWDYGSENTQVPHRRWLLYPQTQVMGTGDVPAQGNYLAADATWVIDSNVNGPRPTTTYPFVAWPPPGFVPYSVVYPQWSFALSNVSLGLATVTMQSNGVPMDVITQQFAVHRLRREHARLVNPSNL